MNPSSIPIVLIAFNNLTFVRSFVEQIAAKRLTQKVIILDNHSLYPPLHAYYDQLEQTDPARYDIRRLDQNYGHLVYQKRAAQLRLPPVFVLSDPDLRLNDEMPADALAQLLALSHKYRSGRVGLALDLSDAGRFMLGKYTGGGTILQWESKFWKHRIENPQYELYHAPIDTTFALHNATYPKGQHIRVAGNFTCKHLPWYRNYLQEHIPDEEMRYFVRNNVSSSILRHVDKTRWTNASVAAGTRPSLVAQASVARNVGKPRTPTPAPVPVPRPPTRSVSGPACPGQVLRRVQRRLARPGPISRVD